MKRTRPKGLTILGIAHSGITLLWIVVLVIAIPKVIDGATPGSAIIVVAFLLAAYNAFVAFGIFKAIGAARILSMILLGILSLGGIARICLFLTAPERSNLSLPLVFVNLFLTIACSYFAFFYLHTNRVRTYFRDSPETPEPV